MSFLSGIAKIAKPLTKAASSVSKMPFVGKALGAVPFVGTALTAASLANDVMSNFGGGGKKGGLPALAGSPAGLPALPGTGTAPVIVGKRGVLRNDANVPDALKAFTISKPDLHQYYRSPIKGYVIRHDSNGDPYAIPKKMAQQYLGYKPAKKPPISVGEYQALRKAKRAIHKVRKIHGLIKYVNDNTAHGGKVIIHHKKKGHK